MFPTEQQGDRELVPELTATQVEHLSANNASQPFFASPRRMHARAVLGHGITWWNFKSKLKVAWAFATMSHVSWYQKSITTFLPRIAKQIMNNFPGSQNQHHSEDPWDFGHHRGTCTPNPVGLNGGKNDGTSLSPQPVLRTSPQATKWSQCPGCSTWLNQGIGNAVGIF